MPAPQGTVVLRRVQTITITVPWSEDVQRAINAPDEATLDMLEQRAARYDELAPAGSPSKWTAVAGSVKVVGWEEPA